MPDESEEESRKMDITVLPDTDSEGEGGGENDSQRSPGLTSYFKHSCMK